MIACFIILFSFFTQAEYVQAQGDYSLIIGKNSEVEVKVLPKGYIETFILKDEKGTEKYVMSITKIKTDPNKPFNIFDEKFKKIFLTKCGCEISEDEAINYKTFKARRCKIAKSVKSQILVSYIVSTMKGSSFYSICYMSNSSQNVEKYRNDFESVINTMEIKK
jgi:hypothetical protein